MAICKRQAFLSHNKANGHYANYSLQIRIFPQILGKISVHEFGLSYTDRLLFFSSGLEHRLFEIDFDNQAPKSAYLNIFSGMSRQCSTVTQWFEPGGVCNIGKDMTPCSSIILLRKGYL